MMQTYRCPFCGSKHFEIQDIQTLSGKAEAKASVLLAGVQVECLECHWVGTLNQLGGHH